MSGPVAVVGAGMAGASAAGVLAAEGREVVVFDKGRGVGGRMARRRIEVGGRSYSFDHGAQWTHARDEDYAQFLAAAVTNGEAARWAGAAAPDGVVGVPSMNALVRTALGTAATRFGATVTGLAREGAQWRLLFGDGASAGGFSGVILTVPPVQLVPLVEAHSAAFAAAAQDAKVEPCWALMLVFADEVAERLGEIRHDALSGEGLAFVAFEGGKPGRSGPCLTVHASGEWSQRELERERDDVAQELSRTVCRALDLPAPMAAQAHRWRYARVVRTNAPAKVYDPKLGLGVAGDWTEGPNVEAAYVSGLRCARAILMA